MAPNGLSKAAAADPVDEITSTHSTTLTTATGGKYSMARTTTRSNDGSNTTGKPKVKYSIVINDQSFTCSGSVSTEMDATKRMMKAVKILEGASDGESEGGEKTGEDSH